MIVESFIAVGIFGLSLWYLGSPLFSKEEGGAVHSATDNLYLKKETILSTLKDLELDFQMKKISDEDYRQLKNEAYEEGAEILRKIDHA